MTSELITFNHLRWHSSSTELVTESTLGEVQMKPPNTYFTLVQWKVQTSSKISANLKNSNCRLSEIVYLLIFAFIQTIV